MVIFFLGGYFSFWLLQLWLDGLFCFLRVVLESVLLVVVIIVIEVLVPQLMPLVRRLLALDLLDLLHQPPLLFILFVDHLVLAGLVLGGVLLLVDARLLILLLCHERGDVLDELQEADAVLGIAADDLYAAEGAEVHLEHLLAEEVNEKLDVLGHFLLALAWLHLAEVEVWECRLEELDVELIAVRSSLVVLT